MTTPTGSNALVSADLVLLRRFGWNPERHDAWLSRAVTPSHVCPPRNQPVMPLAQRLPKAPTKWSAAEADLQHRTVNNLVTERVTAATDQSDISISSTDSKDQYA